MPRLRRIAGAAPAVLAFAACFKVADVVQPSTVRAGADFEVTVAVLTAAAFGAAGESRCFGVLAVSLPEGAAVREGSFAGIAEGGMMPLTNGDEVAPGERPGYRWWVLVTREPLAWAAATSATLEVKLRLCAGPDAGDYRLAYAAGAAPPTVEGRPDAARLIWENTDEATRTARGVTFK